MRRTIALLCLGSALLVVGAAKSAQATEVGYNRRIGVGFVLGLPTGVTGKFWVGNTNALDLDVGFWGPGWGWGCDNAGHCFGGGGIHVALDYLWQSNIVKDRSVQLDWHIGGGALIFAAGGGAAGGARMPVGIDLMFTNAPFLEIFLELAPALVFPGPGFFFEGGLGARFYP